MTTIALLASLTILSYALCYLAVCAASPWGRCRRCHGRRYHRTAIGTRRDCRRCDGTGIRVRLGRRLLDYIRNEYRGGHQ
ncbi:hypothetical protein O7630_22895 [Micromonospora sp. WMMD718]|uniref:hypothetical protein n=1 Tax=unclassified Micromonospora TaxID=2617518 RepID=UPI00064C2C18|nr:MULTISPECIES: hypothetical protein [unclassified Micromonospora]MDG4753790.1 hypothetical protein [Micromonospora sp. WMMD718]